MIDIIIIIIIKFQFNSVASITKTYPDLCVKCLRTREYIFFMYADINQ